MNATKYIHELKAGDFVIFHGATFRVLEDARESNAHRPLAAHLTTAAGPSDCAVARSVCIAGQETPGYIQHGREWTFQGNFRAGRVSVVTVSA